MSWVEARDGKLKAFIGEVQIFDISIIGGARPWIMRSQLPDYQRRTWRTKEPWEAKDVAETVFADWLKAATFT